MKFNKSSQLLLVSAASLAAASLVTACSQFTETLTVDFVYVASNKAAGADNYGEIDVFEINSESGRMRQIPSSPFPSGGRNPVAESVSTDFTVLFVANHDDNTIVDFVIGTDGKLYPYNTINTPGVYPIAMATDKSDLFVVDTYQPLPTCSDAAPCSGSIAVYPLTTATGTAPITEGPPAVNSSLSTTYWPLALPSSADVMVPTSVSVTSTTGANAATYVYVTAYDSSVVPSKGYIFGFAVGSGGVLTPVAGSPFAAGTQPSAIATDSAGAHVYVTDFSGADVLGYSLAAANGALTPLTSGTGGTNRFPAGNQPSAIVLDPTYSYAYVANSLDSTVTAYTISNGALNSVGTYSTGSQPVALGIDPSTNRFLYSVNFLGNSVSGWQLNTDSGTLLISQFSPYAASDQPDAVAAIPHNGTGGGIQP